MVTRTNMMYRALKISASTEYNQIIKVHHARAVSRIGFIAQDMKDLEDELLVAIQNRGIEINNNNAECLRVAEGLLANSTEDAGNVIVFVSRDWSEELYILNDDFVDPLLKEVELLTSLFDIEMLKTLVSYNPVTQLQDIVFQLYLEAVLFDMLFEYFVTDFYNDFVLFDMLTNEKNGRIFRQLNEALVNYTTSVNLIRSSLSDCNE